MIPMYHKGGPYPCFKVAVFFKQRHQHPYEMKADNTVKTDGTQPAIGEYPVCGSCGKPVHVQWLSESPICEAA